MTSPPLPFRIGSTSYVYPDALVPNAAKLAGEVDDIELVLFDTGEQSNLPDEATIRRLAEIARQAGMTYTVHLPMDLEGMDSDDAESQPPSLRVARQVVSAAQALNPWGYIVHLEGETELARGNNADWNRWRRASVLSLQKLADVCGDPTLLCVENLERYPHEEVFPVLDMLPVSLCLDVGHLWLGGVESVPIYRQFQPRIRVIHLHGLREHDHLSLNLMPNEAVYSFLDELERTCYDGILTLEVFGTSDFFSSREVVREWAQRRRRAE